MRMDVMRAVILTVSLGGTVMVSWVAVRGTSVLNGPGPFLDPTWYAVWSIQAALASVIGLVAGRAWGGQTSAARLIALVVAAWVGELLVVTMIGPLLSNDLDVIHGPFIWLVATGGLLQPVATAVGVLIGRATLRETRSQAL
jgi:hypothetical protein